MIGRDKWSEKINDCTWRNNWRAGEISFQSKAESFSLCWILNISICSFLSLKTHLFDEHLLIPFSATCKQYSNTHSRNLKNICKKSKYVTKIKLMICKNEMHLTTTNRKTLVSLFIFLQDYFVIFRYVDSLFKNNNIFILSGIINSASLSIYIFEEIHNISYLHYDYIRFLLLFYLYYAYTLWNIQHVSFMFLTFCFFSSVHDDMN